MKIVDIPKQDLNVPIRMIKDKILVEVTVKLSFKDWMQVSLDSYAPLGKTAKAAREAARIADAISNGNGSIKLEGNDLDTVKAAIEAAEWLPGANRLLVSFYDAIDKAQDVKP